MSGGPRLEVPKACIMVWFGNLVAGDWIYIIFLTNYSSLQGPFHSFCPHGFRRRIMYSCCRLNKLKRPSPIVIWRKQAVKCNNVNCTVCSVSQSNCKNWHGHMWHLWRDCKYLACRYAGIYTYCILICEMTDSFTKTSKPFRRNTQFTAKAKMTLLLFFLISFFWFWGKMCNKHSCFSFWNRL